MKRFSCIAIGLLVGVATVGSSVYAANSSSSRGQTMVASLDVKNHFATFNVDGVETGVRGRVMGIGFFSPDGYLLTIPVMMRVEEEPVYLQLVAAGFSAKTESQTPVFIPLVSENCGDQKPISTDPLPLGWEDKNGLVSERQVIPTCSQHFLLFAGECVSGRCFKDVGDYTGWKLDHNRVLLE